MKIGTTGSKNYLALCYRYTGIGWARYEVSIHRRYPGYRDQVYIPIIDKKTQEGFWYEWRGWAKKRLRELEEDRAARKL